MKDTKNVENDGYEDLEDNDNESETGDRTEAKEVAEDKIEKLEAELLEKEEKINELKDRIRHLKADFDNYKKRQTSQREDEMDKARGELIMDIVPIYDNLDRAFKSFEKNDDKDSFIEGIERIYAQFDELLSKRNVEPIEAKGKKFDPNKHQALMRVESEKHENNEITEVFERGYKYKEKVLKPSKVKVNIHPSQDDGNNDS